MSDPRLLALYGAAPDQFVQERNALARALKGEGKAAEAKEVAALKRPAAAAWAINQVARERRALLEAVLAADEALRKAQTGGADSGALRAAMTAQREALREASRAAEEKLPAMARSAQARAIHATLAGAAAGDAALRERLLAGTLDQTLEAPGFDALAGIAIAAPVAQPAPPAPPAPAVSRAPTVAERAAGRSQRQDQRRVKAAREIARRQARALEQAAKKLETKADLLTRASAQAQAARERAHAAAEKATASAARAEEDALAAQSEAAAARKKADEARALVPQGRSGESKLVRHGLELPGRGIQERLLHGEVHHAEQRSGIAVVGEPAEHVRVVLEVGLVAEQDERGVG